jgi:hypothetical protein
MTEIPSRHYFSFTHCNVVAIIRTGIATVLLEQRRVDPVGSEDLEGGAQAQTRSVGVWSLVKSVAAG